MSNENFKQNPDGTFGMINNDGVYDLLIGGPSIPSATAPRVYAERSAKLPLVGGTDTGGGILSYQNVTGYDMIIQSVVMDVTTVASAACSIGVGVTSTSGTTSATNLIASQDVNTAAGTFGASTPQKLPNGKWLTVSKVSGASAGLVGNLYVSYCPV